MPVFKNMFLNEYVEKLYDRELDCKQFENRDFP